MPRPQPLVALHGAVDFNRFIPFDAEPSAPPLAINDLLVMRRAAGGANVLVTVGDIQAHGGAVNIADLLGGTNDQMLFRLAGIWTATSLIALIEENANRKIRIAALGISSDKDASLELVSIFPSLLFSNTAAPSNAKNWRLTVDSNGTLRIETKSDSGSGASPFMQATRSGPNPQIVTWFIGAGQTAAKWTSGASFEAYHNNVKTFETLAAAAGGAQVDNQATGGGLERVLTVSDLPSGLFPELVFDASDFENPNNADWDVNALAPAVADSNNNALTVRAFDDTVVEGVGGYMNLPVGAVNFTLNFVGRAETTPAGTRNVRMSLRVREIPDDAAVVAPPWITANLSNFDIPTNENFQFDSQTFTFAFFGFAAGELIQFELVRVNTIVGTDLSGDYDLLRMRVSFA